MLLNPLLFLRTQCILFFVAIFALDTLSCPSFLFFDLVCYAMSLLSWFFSLRASLFVLCYALVFLPILLVVDSV